MVQELTPFDKFLQLFHLLKDEAGGAPNRLVVFYTQKQSLKDAADALMRYYVWGDFKRRLLHSRRKWHPQVPEDFLTEWDDFDVNWLQPLWDVWLPINLSSLGISTDEGEMEHKPRKHLHSGPSNGELEPPDPRVDDHFDPTIHDGGRALQLALVPADLYADEVGGDFEDTVHRGARIGLEAFDYLENTIGFDSKAVFRRWQEVPVTYIPVHVSRKHEWADKGSLFQLLDDATRAYVFGAPCAAIAMCRAILEMVLKEHYRISEGSRGHSENDRPGLADLIVLADKKYDFVQGDRLRKLNGKANTILHSFQTSEGLSAADESVIIEFFKTLKFLIQRAPG